VKELHPHLTGLEAVAFAIKLTPHWSGHRDLRPDPGVGNAELYCLIPLTQLPFASPNIGAFGQRFVVLC
jgi:hypothetical protein